MTKSKKSPRGSKYLRLDLSKYKSLDIEFTDRSGQPLFNFQYQADSGEDCPSVRFGRVKSGNLETSLCAFDVDA